MECKDGSAKNRYQLIKAAFQNRPSANLLKSADDQSRLYPVHQKGA